MMIEPTETETKETLDSFALKMNQIDDQIDIECEELKNAPYKTPIRRLDETKANRELDIKWNTKG